MPPSSPPSFEIALRLRSAGRPLDAIEAFKKALSEDPQFAEAHHQLGNVYKSLRRYSEAIVSLRRATELAPALAAAWLNLGVAQLESASRDDAIRSFEKALALEPARPEAHNILGTALLAAGRSTEAQQQFEEALRFKSAYPAAHDNLGRLLRAEGRADEAIQQFRAALNHGPNPSTHSNLLYALNFSATQSPEAIFAEHRAWNSLYAAPLRSSWRPLTNELNATRKLRIGYLSPDFVHHAVSYFIEPVLAAHDRAQFEIYCYANAPLADHVTARLRLASDHWCDIAGLPDDQAATRIREDKIDLLVDLAGHTARHRLLVFARKPAPIQLTWMGYPNTTGLDAIDYRLTDAIADPPGKTEAWHSEKLLRLPENFSCYRPPEDSPPVAPLPSEKNGYVTFGSFNHLSKIGPRVIERWARLLGRLPHSRLFLKARNLADEATVKRLLVRFGDLGVSPARLEIDRDELSVAKHLALYGKVDLALDPFPYNGTTTTCETLWMGVPVLTLAGQTHVARVTASILTNLGLKDWIAYSEEQYEEIALLAAANLPSLALLRNELRKRMRASPLCDAARFTKNLENSYRQIWAEYVTPTR